VCALAGGVLLALLLPALAGGLELGAHRDFRIGMDLPAALRAAQADPSQVAVLHRRPALIQEIEWRPGSSGAAAEAESVRVAVLTFYNGQLARIFVDYAEEQTAGLGANDVVEAVSALYGTPTRPAVTLATGSRSLYAYQEHERVLARWQDEETQVNLIRSTFQPVFAMVILSRRLDALREKATVEAARLDIVEAPQVERTRVRDEADKERAKLEQARVVNKRRFRPE
jgi:hypothetical protein